MVEPDPQHDRKTKPVNSSSDSVAGDKITVDDILNSAVAIGDGAQAILNYYEQPEKNLTIWSGVPPKPPFLVGRDKLVRDLIAELVHGPGQALAVHGLPGVGKTTLAVALANQKEVLDHFQDGVLWASLGPEAGEEAGAGILTRWADALGIDISLKFDLAARREALEEAIGQSALLIVIDDAWDEKVARHLRFSNPNCRHLLTTRKQEVAAGFLRPGETVIPVPTLEEGPARRLLQMLAPEAHAANPGAVQALAQAVGGLPLALELLGGYLAAPRHKLRPQRSQKALAELLDPRRRLQLAQERLGKSGAQETLQEAIALSIDSLSELPNGEELQQAFYALGAFAPKPDLFSWEAAEAVSGHNIEELVLRNLVEISGDQLAMHQVISDVAQVQTDETSIDRHCTYYLNLVHEDPQDWQQIEAVYGQIKWAWESITKEDALYDMVWALQTYQRRRGLLHDSLAWSQRGLDQAQKSGWPEGAGRFLNDIGSTYHGLGRLEEALQYRNQALIVSKQLGNQDFEADILQGMGAIHTELGEVEKALDYYKEALVLSQEVGNRLGQASITNKIGVAYAILGQWPEALEYYRQALSIRQALNDREGESATRFNIGVVYANTGHPEKALEQYNLALSISEELGDRGAQAETLSRIGELYAELGQRGKAMDYFKLALVLTEEAGQRNWQAMLLYQIALLYHSLGQLEDALAYYTQSVPLLNELGDWAGLAGTMFNMALILYSLESLAESAALLEQVVAFDEMAQHPDAQKHRTALAQIKAELAQKGQEKE